MFFVQICEIWNFESPDVTLWGEWGYKPSI